MLLTLFWLCCLQVSVLTLLLRQGRKAAVGQVSSTSVFRSDQVGHARLFRREPFLFPLFVIPSAPCYETSPEGPSAVKPTREELQARVELLGKKRRSAKRKAQAPSESSLLARGKI